MSSNPPSASGGERGDPSPRSDSGASHHPLVSTPSRPPGSGQDPAKPWQRAGRYVRNPRTGLTHRENWSPTESAPKDDAAGRGRTQAAARPATAGDRPAEGRRGRDVSAPSPSGRQPLSLASLQQLLDINPDGVVIVDGEDRVLLHNTRAAELLAIHPEDLRRTRFPHPYGTASTSIEVRDDQGHPVLLEIRAVAIDCAGTPAVAVTLHKGVITDRASINDPAASFHDELTALPGRELFLNRVHDALRRARFDGDRSPDRKGHVPDDDEVIAIARVDLDRFRSVNESYGPRTGDRVLQGVANRLTTGLRPGDYAGRLAGDDFAMLLAPGSLEDQMSVAERVLESLRQPFDIDGHTITCHPSIGLARHLFGQGEDELLVAAEVALLGDRVNGSGSGTVAVNNERLETAHYHLATVGRSVTRALAEDQLFLVYQPVFNLRDDSIVSLEALVRWDHPDDGLIEPVEFIRTADQTGTIIALGEWVLSEVVDQILDWRERQPDAAIPPVSINVTGRQLLHPGFRRHALLTLARRGLDASAIRFEVTELALMDRRTRIDLILKELSGDGFELDLDDFGTGLSSMTHLKEFAISAIKIDGSFVRGVVDDVKSRQLVEASILAAHAFEIAVVAEGVETTEQRDLLTRWGCDLAQGYLMARPLSAIETPRFFVSSKPSPGPLLRSQGLLRRES